MRPVLDDLELPQVQQITTRDQRSIVEFKPPGSDGSFLQNLGREPTHLVLSGVVAAPDALEFVQTLDAKFRESQAVSFVADIVADSEIQQMRIDDFRVEELGGKPQRFAYTLVMHEFIEPVVPEIGSPLDFEILGDAESLMDDLIPGLDLGLNLPTGLEPFVSQFSDLLSRLQQAGEAVQ